MTDINETSIAQLVEAMETKIAAARREPIRQLPEAVSHALNCYRDRCWKGGDPVPERIVLERAIEEHIANSISAALDRVIPPVPTDDELAQWISEGISDADLESDYYASGKCGVTDVQQRQGAEHWAREARLFRAVRAKLFPVDPTPPTPAAR